VKAAVKTVRKACSAYLACTNAKRSSVTPGTYRKKVSRTACHNPQPISHPQTPPSTDAMVETVA